MSNTFRYQNRSTLLVLAAAVSFISCTDGPPTAPQFPRPRVAALASPPSSVPSSVYDETNVIHDTPRMAGRFLRNTLVLLFKPGTSAADRDSAVSAVQGSVVGGNLLTADDGTYMVQIPDDGTDGPLFLAISTLSGMPQVMHAGPVLLLPPDTSLAYLAPHDAPSWSNWRLSPDSARGSNWAAEAIAAPLAWGCATGDSTVPIAVVDQAFHTLVDVDSNVTRQSPRNLFPANDQDVATYHGDGVSSILASRGDNRIGMTGIMWRAGIRQYEGRKVGPNGQLTTDQRGGFLVPSITVTESAVQAALGGATVINMSWGVPYPGVGLGHVMTQIEIRRANAIGAEFSNYMRWLGWIGRRPLIVIAAGNYRVDATFSGFPQAVEDPSLADRILVVGASHRTTRRADTLATFSNRGSLVEIAAPGDSVLVFAPSGAERAVSGTSFSAPAVTGVAGLMLSLDPTLSAADLKRLLIAGAVRGQRTAGGIPILNAYESLKLVAQRAGAGLCGNRVWAQGNDVIVERGSASTETIFTSSTRINWLQVQHGSRIQFPNHDIVLRSGQWVEAPSTLPVDTAYGGTDNSLFGYSHADDSIAYTIKAGPSDFPTGYDVYVRPASYRNGAPKFLTTLPAAGAPPSLVVCHYRLASTDHCEASVDVGAKTPGSGDSYITDAGVGYSPYGDEVFVTVPYLSTSASPGNWHQCNFSGNPNDQCRVITVGRTTDSSVTYAVRISDGASTRLWSSAGRQAYHVGAAEGPTPSLVSGLGTSAWAFDWSPSYPPSNIVHRVYDCGIDYHTRAGVASPFIANSDACTLNTPATIAPQRSVTGASLLSHH